MKKKTSVISFIALNFIVFIQVSMASATPCPSLIEFQKIPILQVDGAVIDSGRARFHLRAVPETGSAVEIEGLIARNIPEAVEKVRKAFAEAIRQNIQGTITGTQSGYQTCNYPVSFQTDVDNNQSNPIVSFVTYVGH